MPFPALHRSSTTSSKSSSTLTPSSRTRAPSPPSPSSSPAHSPLSLSPPPLPKIKPLSLRSHLSQAFPPSPTYTPPPPSSLPSLTVLITGGTSGIGLSTTLYLLRAGARICIASHTPAPRASSIITSLLSTPNLPPTAHAWHLPLDLADLTSVRAAATTYMSRESTLHLLINNGGIMHSSYDPTRSAQGHDLQFAVNALGHWHLTQCLMPILLHTASTISGCSSTLSRRSSLDSSTTPSLAHDSESSHESESAPFPTTPPSLPSNSTSKSPIPSPSSCSHPTPEEAAQRIGVRVITLSSNVHHFAPVGAIAWETLGTSGGGGGSSCSAEEVGRQDKARRKLGGMGCYAQSKMANVLLNTHLAHTLSPHTSISFIVAHPGGVRTSLYSRGLPKWQAWLTNMLLYPPEMGALTTLWAATREGGMELNGKYCIPWARIGEARADGEDVHLAARLAALCEEFCEGY